jgi:hypothetical protein
MLNSASFRDSPGSSPRVSLVRERGRSCGTKAQAEAQEMRHPWLFVGVLVLCVCGACLAATVDDLLRPEMVHLRRRSIDVTREPIYRAFNHRLRSGSAALQNDFSESALRPFLVTFREHAFDNKARLRELGVHVQDFVPPLSFLVRCTSQGAMELHKEASIRWLGELLPSDKLLSEIDPHHTSRGRGTIARSLSCCFLM